MKLAQQCETLVKQHAAEEEEHNLFVSNLENTIQERDHQYQVQSHTFASSISNCS